MSLHIVGPGEGEVIGDTPARHVSILSGLAPLHATYNRFAGGQDGAGLHIHKLHSDLFYVLSGTLTVRLGPQDEALEVPAGSLACVPPGVVHGFRNASGAPETHLNFHAPGADFLTYLRGLRDGVRIVYDQHDPPADGGRPITEATRSDADLLIDAEAIRVERLHGATDPLPADRLCSYYALEGPLKVVADEREAETPQGGFIQVTEGEQHAADGAAFLRIVT
jgi:quercetin dioxygenase-like cupin family protein